MRFVKGRPTLLDSYCNLQLIVTEVSSPPLTTNYQLPLDLLIPCQSWLKFMRWQVCDRPHDIALHVNLPPD
ncbi:MAG: hypothetical protein CLLPBCKN_002963 [Chroococcidiopsis cubana SAG 39.79]|nr:hypothetical protein [Chroococcidiopsis cubana SAG 39.79]